MSDVLIYGVEDGVAIITLNRPERRNAINAELGEALNKALVRAVSDKEVRALIITGAGEAFCSGADSEHLSNAASGGRPLHVSPTEPDPQFLEALPETPPHLRSRYTFAGAMSIPTIAVVNGPAIGAGMALALSCDFRFGAPKTAFAGGFVRIGAVAEMGLAWTTTQIIGSGRARDLLLSGRRVDAEEALNWGLMTRIFPQERLLDEAKSVATEMVQRCSPRSIRHVKKMLDAAPSQTFAQAFEMARRETRPALESADFKEGVAAMRENRLPNWPAE
jgi:enoyl-CoA hydratase/carnithine racemase